MLYADWCLRSDGMPHSRRFRHVDVAAENPVVLAAIAARLAALQPGVFSPDRGASSPLASKTAAARGGYWGPFVFP